MTKDQELDALRSRAITDDEFVSQYGSRETGEAFFWDRPRPKDRDGLSAMLGKVTPAEARKPVRRVGALTEDDGVRYARVGDLRKRGFIVTHTPSRGNTDHVSIRYPGAWDDDISRAFDESWSNPQWHEEGGSQ